MKTPKNHPMQGIVLNKGGAPVFQANAIVKWMLEQGAMGRLFNMNAIACQAFSDEDRRQFAQLIGYSVSGYCDLSYVNDENATLAQNCSQECTCKFDYDHDLHAIAVTHYEDCPDHGLRPTAAAIAAAATEPDYDDPGVARAMLEMHGGAADD